MTPETFATEILSLISTFEAESGEVIRKINYDSKMYANKKLEVWTASEYEADVPPWERK